MCEAQNICAPVSISTQPRCDRRVHKGPVAIWIQVMRGERSDCCLAVRKCGDPSYSKTIEMPTQAPHSRITLMPAKKTSLRLLRMRLVVMGTEKCFRHPRKSAYTLSHLIIIIGARQGCLDGHRGWVIYYIALGIISVFLATLDIPVRCWERSPPTNIFLPPVWRRRL